MDCILERKVGVSNLLLPKTWNMMLVRSSKERPSHLGPYGERGRLPSTGCTHPVPESSVGKTRGRVVEGAGPQEDIYRITEVL